MKYAVLGDIHANLEALEAVLADAAAQGAERFVSTGDIVGYNADPRACLRLLRRLDVIAVQGNHDYYAAKSFPTLFFNPIAAKSIQWTRKRLSLAERRFLGALPLVLDTADFSLVHGSLAAPAEWPYVLSEADAAEHFRNQFAPLCFAGHTHIPGVFFCDDRGRVFSRPAGTFRLPNDSRCLITAGSVGQPRDGDPRAAYVLYDSETRTVSFRRVEYDIAAAQKKVLEAGLPRFNAERLAAGR